ncbi:hypothetical protein GOODEAATRI_013681 [Goodea atripinnis]|uniref:Uncharacterized protein n=1 Tax=Goodea atripinnis TaxID=208336 RepID=A0ABV0NXR8_9TELE
MEELQESPAQVGESVDRTNSGQTHERTLVCCLPQAMKRTPQTSKKVPWTDDILSKLFGPHNLMCSRKLTLQNKPPHPEHTTPIRNMILAASCCEDVGKARTIMEWFRT